MTSSAEPHLIYDSPDWPKRSPSAPSFTTEDNGVTFMIVSAAGAAYTRTLHRLQTELATGRRVSVIATPTAATWFRNSGIANEIERLTGWPLRCEQRMPWEPTFDPPGSSVLASPVTLNTLTQWANGNGPNLAVSLLNEATGTPGLAVRAELHLSNAFAAHPATAEAIGKLRNLGVEISRSPYGGAHLPRA
jgi:hypothetical protein